MHWRKPLAWTVGVVLALGLGATAAVRVFVDPEALKERARAKVREAWQRDLAIGGLELHLFPRPSLRASSVTLGDREGGEPPLTLRADHVRADLELLPLVTGDVRLRALALDGVKAVLGDEPWTLDEAQVTMGDDLADVRIRAQVRRYGQALRIDATFADLSRMGQPGATTRGRILLDWKDTHAAILGTLPIDRRLEGHDFTLQVTSRSIQDALEFSGFAREPTAPFSLALRSRGAEGGAALSDLALQLGELEVRGDLRLRNEGRRRQVEGTLTAQRVDWLKVLADAGGEVRAPAKDGVLFHDDAVAWHALGALGAMDARVDLQLGSLRLASGMELRDVRARATLGGQRIVLAPLSAAALGGSLEGTLATDAKQRTLAIALDGSRLQLDRWFNERGSKLPFEGGPLALEAKLDLHGDTYRDLAASANGRIRLRMGAARWRSARAGEIEEMMVNALAPGGSNDIAFECAALDLELHDGRAQGRKVLGTRSGASRFLAGGRVDLREEKVDLRGRVQANRGVTLGLAAVAGGVRIDGPLARPRIGLDPDDKPALLARAAAAIATTGASLVGEALLNAASKEDPCAIVPERAPLNPPSRPTPRPPSTTSRSRSSRTP